MKKLIPSPIQTDHFTSHKALLPVYERLFDAIKDTKNSVLEIGVNDGGGIRMYVDYFQHAQGFAVDILKQPIGLKSDPRIVYFQMDAYTDKAISMLAGIGGRFALLVDDGPHTAESHAWFCKHYPLLLASDGIAIVEDIKDLDSVKQMALSVPQQFNSMCIDVRHVTGRFDDLIFVIWPKTNP